MNLKAAPPEVNLKSSDDLIKSTSAVPGGLLKSKPTWSNA